MSVAASVDRLVNAAKSQPVKGKTSTTHLDYLARLLLIDCGI